MLKISRDFLKNAFSHFLSRLKIRSNKHMIKDQDTGMGGGGCVHAILFQERGRGLGHITQVILKSRSTPPPPPRSPRSSAELNDHHNIAHQIRFFSRLFRSLDVGAHQRMEDDSLALHVILFVHAMYSWIVGPVVGTWTLLKLITGRQATNTQVIPIIQNREALPQ